MSAAKNYKRYYSYRKTKQNLIVAFSFNGIEVSAAVTGLVSPVFAMITMVASVSLVLANSFAGQLLPGEGTKTDFSGETSELEAEANGGLETHPETAVESTKSASAEPREGVEPAHERVTFDIDLYCGWCEDGVRNTLTGRGGVDAIEANTDEQRVESTVNSHQITIDKLREVLTGLNYKTEIAEAVAIGEQRPES